MHILHTEASNGWGGQEIRILREAISMRERGHSVSFAITEGGDLAKCAREHNFSVDEFPIDRRNFFKAVRKLYRIIKRDKIDIVNTHSSLDAWIAGISARLAGAKIIRTRHLSAPIRPGMNSRVLYGWLADHVITTCEEVAEIICRQAPRPRSTCCSIPTGVDAEGIVVKAGDAEAFREKYGLAHDDIVIVMVCILRPWKGINDLIDSAKLLEGVPSLRWVVVGSGPSIQRYRDRSAGLGLGDKVIFTDHLDNPCPAMAASDIFTLLSTDNEGVSQSSLQAAYLGKPLITTTTGGLKEVCIDGVTGYQVANSNPQQVKRAVEQLLESRERREAMGKRARELVEEKFMWDYTLDAMEEVYRSIVL